MTIRVVCTACHSTSQVVDEAAGATATCPFCSTVFDVPAGPITAQYGQHDNVTTETSARSIPSPFLQRRPLSNSAIEWGQIEPRTCCRIAVELYKSHARILLATHFVFFGTTFGLSWLLDSMVKAGQQELAGLLQIGVMAAIMFLKLGLTLVAFRVARNEEVDLGVLLSGGDRLVRVVIFNILLTFLFLIGCVGFVVPGIYLVLRFWAGSFFIIDQNCGVFEAFGLAGKYSDGNRLPSLMLALISLGLAAFGVSLFGVGLLLVFPLLTLIWVIAYLMLTRQPIERPLA